MEARSVLGIVLVAVQAVQVAPLVAHAIRTRSAAGVSVPGEAAWAVGGLGWALFGYWTGSPILVVSGCLAAVASGTLTALLWRAPEAARGAAAGLAALTAVALAIPSLAVGVAGLSVALSVFGVVQFLPQLRQSLTAWRSRASTPGVSVTGAVVRSVYTAGWALWGGAYMLWGLPPSGVDWPIVAWGVAGAVTFAVQALAARRARSGRR